VLLGVRSKVEALATLTACQVSSSWKIFFAAFLRFAQ
jgi:hypothetical protein